MRYKSSKHTIMNRQNFATISNGPLPDEVGPPSGLKVGRRHSTGGIDLMASDEGHHFMTTGPTPAMKRTAKKPSN